MEVSYQLHVPVTSSPGTSRWYPLNVRVGGNLVILLKSVGDFSNIYWGTFKETQTGSVEDVEGET